jgi:hypothetical protein
LAIDKLGKVLPQTEKKNPEKKIITWRIQLDPSQVRTLDAS